MTNKSKQKGTAWETEVVNYLQEWDFRARRKTLSGREDRGDIELLELPLLTIEAKNEKTYKLAEWVEEAVVEAKNCSQAHFGIVWAHRNRKSNPGDGYVIMTGETFRRLLVLLKKGYT